MQDLAVEVRLLNRIAIHHAKCAHSRAGNVRRSRAAQPARPDYEDGRAP